MRAGSLYSLVWLYANGIDGDERTMKHAFDLLQPRFPQYFQEPNSDGVQIPMDRLLFWESIRQQVALCAPVGSENESDEVSGVE